jgi:hypothetical protein
MVNNKPILLSVSVQGYEPIHLWIARVDAINPSKRTPNALDCVVRLEMYSIEPQCDYW